MVSRRKIGHFLFHCSVETKQRISSHRVSYHICLLAVVCNVRLVSRAYNCPNKDLIAINSKNRLWIGQHHNGHQQVSAKGYYIRKGCPTKRLIFVNVPKHTNNYASSLVGHTPLEWMPSLLLAQHCHLDQWLTVDASFVCRWSGNETLAWWHRNHIRHGFNDVTYMWHMNSSYLEQFPIDCPRIFASF